MFDNQNDASASPSLLTHSKALFEDFLEFVVRGYVFSESERSRVDGPLNAKDEKKISDGSRIDGRIPYLMTLSGKGGYIEGDAFSGRVHYRNVTLLDHSISVARGGAVFLELDLRAYGLDEASLKMHVAEAIAVGFLHDADKMLEQDRRSDILCNADIASVMDRYGITLWLERHGVSITPAEMLAKINAVEITRSDFVTPDGELLQPSEVRNSGYVKLADRLDGIFLDSQKTPEDLIDEIQQFGVTQKGSAAANDVFRTNVLQQGWRKVHIRAPQTPFILSNFQLGLSAAVQSVHGMPPLFEVHHDGEFFALIPETRYDEVIDLAVEDAVRPLNMQVRIDTNPKGSRDILDAKADCSDILDAAAASQRDASSALFVHKKFLTGAKSLTAEIDALLAPFNFMPDFSGLTGFEGSHYQPWPAKEQDLDRDQKRAKSAALAIVLACTEPSDKKLAKTVPDFSVRESELLQLLSEFEHTAPSWVIEMDKLSRLTIVSVWAACLCDEDPDLDDRIFRDSGLIDLWLSGDGHGRSGLCDKIVDLGEVLIPTVKDWLGASITRAFVEWDESAKEGFCHFTGLPVMLSKQVDGKLGLDGVKVSAFSGREGRPASPFSSKSQTLISDIALAEQKLRIHAAAGHAEGKIPNYISSPSMMGLFASLNLKSDRDFLSCGHFDLLRLEDKSGKKPLPVTDIYGQRIFFGQHVSMPEKTIDVLEYVEMMMRSALRMGRPVHIFKGLPVLQNSFFYFDAMPPVLKRALGGNSLRLEQLRPSLKILGVIKNLAEINAAGLDVALRFADPDTRFAAACQGIVIIDHMPTDKQKNNKWLRNSLYNATQEMEADMSENENAVVQFAKAMTEIQEWPGSEASNNVKTFGLRVALEAIEDCVNEIHQYGRDSLVAAVAGAVQMEMERSGRVQWNGRAKGVPFPAEKMAATAELFVDEVWGKAFSGKAPASKARRIASAVYQVGFETAYRRKFDSHRAEKAEAPSES